MEPKYVRSGKRSSLPRRRWPGDARRVRRDRPEHGAGTSEAKADTHWDLLFLWQRRLMEEWRRELPPCSDLLAPIEIAGMVEYLERSTLPCSERVRFLTGFLSIVHGTWHGRRFLASAEEFVALHLER